MLQPPAIAELCSAWMGEAPVPTHPHAIKGCYHSSAMKSASIKLLPLWLCLLLAPCLYAASEPKLSPLPAPVSNNAVAVSHDEGGTKVYSFMGMGPKKTWDAIAKSTYEMDLDSGKWTERRPVPGVAGRLAASAVALHDQVFIFGGYVVDAQGGETTVSDLNVFVPIENRYYRGKDIPVPVDDAVVGLYRDRYIFLIGGWSTARGDTVREVQIYDTDKDTWLQGTPLPGTPVFGHAGAILGDTIVYVDGAYKNPNGPNPKYVASSECWMGKIPKKGDITKIEWTKLPAHPGNARYRIAAGAGQLEKKGGRVYFSGGTDNPYNYNGIGYNGQPAEPSPVTFAFNLLTGAWETVSESTPEPTMDHRGLLVTRRGLLLVGGMEKGQQVTAKVAVVKPAAKK
ncbi:MAG: galactose oxidase [Acidobacteriia bacterium]|nr:galactose oxidase [Terriglobia bacterium]